MLNLLKFVVIFFLLFNLYSCDKAFVYEENLKIENAEWNRDKKAIFSFEIEDTTAIYALYVNFRHGGEYPYRNIYLFAHSKSPRGKTATDTAQMLLANAQGKWMGKGIGDIYDYQFKFKEGDLFPEKGTYKIEVEQAMREKALLNVTDIGISIKKVKP